MHFIEELKKEHAEIERELIEMETIIESANINYPNLIHTYKKIHELWNQHEKKEESVFPILKSEKIIIPVKKMLFEHKELAPHKRALIEAINSANNTKIKEALDNHFKIIIEKLRKHMNLEDEILFRITVENFNEKEIKDTLNENKNDKK